MKIQNSHFIFLEGLKSYGRFSRTSSNKQIWSNNRTDFFHRPLLATTILVWWLEKGLGVDISRLRYMSRSTTKPTKWHKCPANTQISLDIRPVWSVFDVRSIFNWGPNVSSCGQPDLSLRWAHMSFCWFCHAAAHIKLRETKTEIWSLFWSVDKSDS